MLGRRRWLNACSAGLCSTLWYRADDLRPSLQGSIPCVGGRCGREFRGCRHREKLDILHKKSYIFVHTCMILFPEFPPDRRVGDRSVNIDDLEWLWKEGPESISVITLVWFGQVTKFVMVTHVGSSVFRESSTPSIRRERSPIAHRLGETTTAFAILHK